MALFEAKRRIAFSETDMAGIVHFANFYRYMEEAEHALFRDRGLSIMQHLPDGSIIGWPRVSAKCNYEAPAVFEDVIDIHVDMERRGVKSLTLNYTFYRGETRLARGQMKTVCCIFKPGEPMKSLEIPPEYVQHFPDPILDGDNG